MWIIRSFFYLSVSWIVRRFEININIKLPKTAYTLEMDSFIAYIYHERFSYIEFFYFIFYQN